MKFYISNYEDNANVKDDYVAVNQINGVIKFGITSRSIEYAEKRRCYIMLNAVRYEETFVQALRLLKVRSVVLEGEVVSLSKFLQLLKSEK